MHLCDDALLITQTASSTIGQGEYVRLSRRSEQTIVVPEQFTAACAETRWKVDLLDAVVAKVRDADHVD